MAYGFNRFLTTHTGSLPRPDDLIRAMSPRRRAYRSTAPHSRQPFTRPSPRW